MKRIFKDILDILDDLMKGIVGFMKGQIIISAVTFIFLGLGLTVIGVALPFLIALGITIFDLLPVLGSGAVMIPWAVISLIAGNTATAAGLAALYLLLTIARQLLEPLIIGKKIGVRPLYTFLSGILGSLIFGPIGLIAGPLTAVLVTSVCRIVRKHNEKTDVSE